MIENLPITPTRQAAAVKGRSAAGRVTGKLAIALMEMVWSGAKRGDAAAKAGMTDHSLRVALKKRHVLAHYRAELAALRESERARTVHAFVDVRDNSDNAMARVSAGKALDAAVAAEPAMGSAAMQPGLLIVVVQPDGSRQSVVPPPAKIINLSSSAMDDMSAIPASEDEDK
jgi:hypothetical protein